MKNIGDLKIIAERERSGMASVWDDTFASERSQKRSMSCLYEPTRYLPKVGITTMKRRKAMTCLMRSWNGRPRASSDLIFDSTY